MSTPVATKAHAAALSVLKGSKPLPGETLLSSHTPSQMTRQSLPMGWGEARPANCVEGSLEIAVPRPVVMVVVHHESTWVG